MSFSLPQYKPRKGREKQPVGRRLRVRVELVIGDLWVGAFVKRRRVTLPRPGWEEWDVHVCLVPCLPIHVSWVSRRTR